MIYAIHLTMGIFFTIMLSCVSFIPPFTSQSEWQQLQPAKPAENIDPKPKIEKAIIQKAETTKKTPSQPIAESPKSKNSLGQQMNMPKSTITKNNSTDEFQGRLKAKIPPGYTIEYNRSTQIYKLIGTSTSQKAEEPRADAVTYTFTTLFEKERKIQPLTMLQIEVKYGKPNEAWRLYERAKIDGVEATRFYILYRNVSVDSTEANMAYSTYNEGFTFFIPLSVMQSKQNTKIELITKTGTRVDLPLSVQQKQNHFEAIQRLIGPTKLKDPQ